MALLAVLLLRPFGLSGHTPLWLLTPLLIAAAVHQQPEIQYRLKPRIPAPAYVFAATVVLYLIGWGALPALAHLRRPGERSWRSVAAAAALAIAAGEVGIATGVLHSYLPQPQVHVLAVVVALAVAGSARAGSRSAHRAEAADLALRAAEERFRAVVRDSGDVIFLAGADAAVTYVSPGARSMLGFEPDALLGGALDELYHPDDRPAVAALGARLLAGDGSTEYTAELRVRHADGEWHTHEVVARNLLADPAVGAVVAHHRDVTERRPAAHDELTGLAGGATLLRDLELALRQGTRYQHPVGVLVLDLDDFKPVNDSYGREVGDRLLRTIGRVLVRCTRDADSVGRLGGDRFAVVLTRVQGADEARTVAARIIAGVANNASVAGLRLDVGCSVGVALAYPGGSDAETLLRHARTAMQRSKRRARNGCAVYVEEDVDAPWQ